MKLTLFLSVPNFFVASKSETLKKAAQLALLTNRLPSEILGLDEESLCLFELDYQLITRELEGEESPEEKKNKIIELLEKRRKKLE